MSRSVLAFRIHAAGNGVQAGMERVALDDLSPGDVVVRVLWSGINYKDALAATGAGKILRTFPLVGGIDLSGIVETSSDSRFRAGDPVLVTGCGLSETRDGGYAEYARVPADCVIALPEGLDPFSAMAIGTAGYAAGLALDRMEHNGQTPDLGPVVVTGATGGVGSLAIDMLAGRGYEVIAVTRKREAFDYLGAIGAARVLVSGEIDLGSRPLESATFGGGIDNVGGELLTWLTRTVRPFGNIASVGLAGNAALNTTVLPFILRGVNLLGINSSASPRERRVRIWDRIAREYAPRHLDRIVTSVRSFAELPRAFAPYLKGAVTGRTVVKVSEDTGAS